MRSTGVSGICKEWLRLWATQNLFSHPRYKDGAATAPNFDSFAFGCAQTKKMLEVGKKLSAETHVFWGGREGFATALNTKAMPCI